MGKLTDEMMRLREEIDAAYSRRADLISGLHEFHDHLHADVHTTLSDFRRVHTDTSRRLREERAAFIGAVADQVHTTLSEFKDHLTHHVADLRATNRQAHADMASDMQARHRAYIDNLRSSVSAARDAAQEQAAAFRAEFQAKSEAARDERREYTDSLRDGITELRHNLTEDRLAAARIFAGLGASAARTVQAAAKPKPVRTKPTQKPDAHVPAEPAADAPPEGEPQP